MAISDIVAKLSIGNYRDKMNAKKINKEENLDKINIKLLDLYTKMLKPEVVEKVYNIELAIKRGTQLFETLNMGWTIDQNGLYFLLVKKTMNDQAIPSYFIPRNESGYYVPDNYIDNEYFNKVRDIEEKLLSKNNELLKQMHNLFTIKKQLLTDPNNLDPKYKDNNLGEDIIEYLFDDKPKGSR